MSSPINHLFVVAIDSMVNNSGAPVSTDTDYLSAFNHYYSSCIQGFDVSLLSTVFIEL